jgi:hypothetical protein
MLLVEIDQEKVYEFTDLILKSDSAKSEEKPRYY